MTTDTHGPSVPWIESRLVAFDTETTGIDVFNDRIVTAAISHVGGGLPARHFDWLANPGIPIPAGATAIHGITDEVAATGTPASEVIDVLAGELCLAMHNGVPVVGYNVAYDLSLLDAECVRHDLPRLHERLERPVGPVICGLVLDKHLHKFRKGSRKLVDTANHYGVPIAAGAAHGAQADALAAARVVWRIGQIGTSSKTFTVMGIPADLEAGYQQVAAMTVAELHAAQVGWAKDQADSLRDYFRRKKQTADAASVDSAWPVRYPKASEAAAVAS